MSEDWPMCERCEREVKPAAGQVEAYTIDLWVQGFTHYKSDDGAVDCKSFQTEGRDYIVLCEECWEVVKRSSWALLCEQATVDHAKSAVSEQAPYALPCASCGGRGQHLPPGHPYQFPQ